MKKIQTKISALVICLVLVLSIVFGVVSCVLNYRTAHAVLETNLSQTVQLAAKLVTSQMEQTKLVAEEFGTNTRIASTQVMVADKNVLLNQKVKQYEFIGGNILDTTGKSLIDGKDYSDRDYFQHAMNGESFISGPLISKVTGEYSIMVSAPVWDQGIAGTKVIGVVYFKPDLEILSRIVDDLDVGATGSAYLLNKEGLNIAHEDRSLVFQDNSIENAKADPSLAKKAAVETKMTAGGTGYGTYTFQGKSWVQAYTPVANTDWSVGVYVQPSEFLENFYLSVWVTIALAVVAIVVGIVLSYTAGTRIAQPIVLCAKRLEALMQGDLQSPMPQVNTKDETRVVADSTRLLAEALADVVRDIVHVLGELSNGNLDVRSTRTYTGDFIPIQTATMKIVSSLNGTLRDINQAADQVSGGSEQVSAGAQALSQGATEQASSIEELSAAIAEISDKVQHNAENAKQARKQSDAAGGEVEAGSRQMDEMVGAMHRISDKSAEISKIIKTIEDIAFQTNILALNAAVEAARAGAAGKGFAVVADEVRNLASKSAAAAKNTTALIEESVSAVGDGTRIADDTARTMAEVVGSVRTVGELIGEIARASGEQAEAIAQITMGVDQISSVVQTNSATAEESAAASEELSSQSQQLRSLVARFKLREDGARQQDALPGGRVKQLQ